MSITLVNTTPVQKLTFSDSKPWSTAKDTGNLLADYAQSEVTAELLDPELSGDLLNSVTPMQSMDVTTVVTTARYKATENQPLWASNPQQSVAPVTSGITSPTFQ